MKCLEIAHSNWLSVFCSWKSGTNIRQQPAVDASVYLGFARGCSKEQPVLNSCAPVISSFTSVKHVNSFYSNVLHIYLIVSQFPAKS